MIGQPVFDHERIYAELYCLTRPAAGGVVAEALGAIENALLDAMAKALGIPCYALLGGKMRDRASVLVALRDLADQSPDLLLAGDHRSRRRQEDRGGGGGARLHRAQNQYLFA